MSSFARRFKSSYTLTKRQDSAMFEIGCFLALDDFYRDRGFEVEPQHLVEGEFKYLTTPAGNPNNYSWLRLRSPSGRKVFELRQQVRVSSEVDPDIAFTPDIVVLKSGEQISGRTDPDYASGRKRFFTANSSRVIAVHECKATSPSPELLVSFIGMCVAAGLIPSRRRRPRPQTKTKPKTEIHLKSTLFIARTASRLHIRMIRALEQAYGVHVLSGLSSWGWDLDRIRKKQLDQLKPRATKKATH